jgi:hypothetical protein
MHSNFILLQGEFQPEKGIPELANEMNPVANDAISTSMVELGVIGQMPHTFVPVCFVTHFYM